VVDGVLALARMADDEPTGLFAAGVAFAVCVVVAVAVWYPLDVPSRVVRAIVPTGSCLSDTPGTATMFLCSTGVAFLTMVGPMAVMVAILLARGWLRRVLTVAVRRVPEVLRFLVAPVLVTMLFTISWAGFHNQETGDVGLLPQIVFPGFVGFCTYLVARYERWLKQRFAAALEARDRLLPRLARVAVAVVVPVLLSWAITHSDAHSSTALKEQLVVILSLVIGWLALAPRDRATLTGTTAA
jgi:hypothetical protein